MNYELFCHALFIILWFFCHALFIILTPDNFVYLKQNSPPGRPPKPPPLASPDPDQANQANQANGNLPDGVLFRVSIHTLGLKVIIL